MQISRINVKCSIKQFQRFIEEAIFQCMGAGKSRKGQDFRTGVLVVRNADVAAPMACDAFVFFKYVYNTMFWGNVEPNCQRSVR